jgi:hypothetical protein
MFTSRARWKWAPAIRYAVICIHDVTVPSGKKPVNEFTGWYKKLR